MEENIMSRKVYATKIVEENGELIMLLTKELLVALQLRDGEILAWELDDDSIVIRRRVVEPNKGKEKTNV